MDTSRTKDFRVAIVGGGVCGLTCAIALAKKGVPVDVFESAGEFLEIGAGVGLGPNSVRILRGLGVFEDVLAKSTDPDLNMNAFRFISGYEGHEVLYDNPLPKEDCGIGILRFAFLNALVGHFDKSKAHFHKRCTNVTPSAQNPSRLVLAFADGTTYEADLVIGADGIRSSVRSIVTGRPSDANLSFSNTIAYRALVSWDQLKDKGLKTDLTKGMTCFAGKGRHIIVYPINGGKTINVVAFVTNMDGDIPVGNGKLPLGAQWVCDAPKDELLSKYEEFGSDIKTLLSCVRKSSKWSIHIVYPPLESYVNGRIALVGDSAHAMRTHLGAGAGQGLEDGYVLSHLLGHPSANANNLEQVLQVYDGVRRPRAQEIWERTARTGEIYEGRGPSGFSPEGFTKDLTYNWECVWHHDLDGDIQAAVKQLEEAGVF
ncbi:unnamed protein product [Somion occarium]|uniref:FAD-binding domain-containing protein n=1 Tax=Somion occarium TaxID=3059160 RepID=A0ABP1CHF2_9APHY